MQQTDNVVVQRVHILGQPIRGLVPNFTRVVNHAKINVALQLFARNKFLVFTLLLMQLIHETFVRRFRKPALFVEKREDARWLTRAFDELDARLQIEAKIDELPVDSFALVLFLNDKW